MECPHCHKRGNALQRLFTRRKHTGTRLCIYCSAEVKFIYNWKRIFFLAAILVVVLIAFNYGLQALGMPGITSGFAGGMAGAILAIVMRRPPYLVIELVTQEKKKKRN